MALAYPATLTKAAWLKQQGVIAKLMKGDTGVAPACDKAELAFKKIDWTAFDGAKGAALPTFEAMQAYMAAMKTEHDKALIPARDALLALAKLCTTVAGQFKGSAVIPKSSREYVEKMDKDAMNLVAGIKGAPDAGIRQLQAAMAKKSEIPKLKAAVGSGGFKTVEGNAKLFAAFRDFLTSKHASEQLAAYEAAKMNTSGKKAADLYLKYIKAGSPQEANVAATLRKQFDDKYAKFLTTKKESEMSGLPWAEVATKIQSEMIAPMVGGFVAEFDKFYTKYA